LLVLGAHVLEQPKRRLGLFLVDLRQGESNVDQHPVAGLRAIAVGIEQANIYRAAHTGNVDPRKPIGLVDELDHLPWNCQAHLGSSSVS
jgi:hypothetical protein